MSWEKQGSAIARRTASLSVQSSHKTASVSVEEEGGGQWGGGRVRSKGFTSCCVCSMLLLCYTVSLCVFSVSASAHYHLFFISHWNDCSTHRGLFYERATVHAPIPIHVPQLLTLPVGIQWTYYSHTFRFEMQGRSTLIAAAPPPQLPLSFSALFEVQHINACVWTSPDNHSSQTLCMGVCVKQMSRDPSAWILNMYLMKLG